MMTTIHDSLPTPMTHTLTFVQLTDLHIRKPGQLAYGKVDTSEYLRTTVESVRALRQRPEAIVITGDLTDFGRAEEYQYMKELLAPLAMPVYLMPGNHDDRQNLRAVFNDHDYLGTTGFVQYHCRIGPLHLLALDTSEPGRSDGRLCSERLAWLDQQLAALEGQAVVVAMHHPPFRTLIGHMDKIGLSEGSVELESLLRRHPNVERVLCGHLHRAIDVRFGGTLASTCPGPAHQVTLNLDPQATSDWMLEPPAFRVHAWDEVNRRLVTHLAPIGSFEGPYPFHAEGKLID